MHTECTGSFLMEVSIPDMSCEGIWSGYTVTFPYGLSVVHAKTVKGIRGKNIPVVVTIKKGKATVFTKYEGERVVVDYQYLDGMD